LLAAYEPSPNLSNEASAEIDETFTIDPVLRTSMSAAIS